MMSLQPMLTAEPLRLVLLPFGASVCGVGGHVNLGSVDEWVFGS